MTREVKSVFSERFAIIIKKKRSKKAPQMFAFDSHEDALRSFRFEASCMGFKEPRSAKDGDVVEDKRFKVTFQELPF